jgi:hypothetical protein
MWKLGNYLLFIHYSNQSIVIGFDRYHPVSQWGRWRADEATAQSWKQVGRQFIHYSNNDAIILVFDSAILVTQGG